LWLQVCGGGFCKIRVFDTQQNGVEYVSKCLDPRDKYEFNKFGLAQSLTFSPACVSAVRATVTLPQTVRRFVREKEMQRFAKAGVPAKSGAKDCGPKLFNLEGKGPALAPCSTTRGDCLQDGL
jgi:hypothetical protein